VVSCSTGNGRFWRTKGGTLIVDPPVSQQATADSGQAVNVISGGTASSGTASNPGSQELSNTVFGGSGGSSGNTASSGNGRSAGNTTSSGADDSAGNHLMFWRGDTLSGPPEWHVDWDATVASNTLGFSDAGNHLGGGWVADDGGAKLALLNQFAMAHFTSASSDIGGTAVSDLAMGASNVNPIATAAHHH
jgi:hypothetical protein